MSGLHTWFRNGRPAASLWNIPCSSYILVTHLTLTLTLTLILLHQPETTATFGSIHRPCHSNCDLSTPTWSMDLTAWLYCVLLPNPLYLSLTYILRLRCVAESGSGFVVVEIKLAWAWAWACGVWEFIHVCICHYIYLVKAIIVRVYGLCVRLCGCWNKTSVSVSVSVR